MPPTHGGKGVERGDASQEGCGGGLERRGADGASGKEVAGSGSGPTGETLQEKAAAASSGGAPTTHLRKGAVDTSSSEGELPEKKATASSEGSAALGALHGNTTAQDCEESDAKHGTKKARTVSSAEIPHEHCLEYGADIGLSGAMLQKQSSEAEADTGLRGDMLHEHPAEEADTAKGIKESDSDEVVHVKEEDTRVQEVKDLIKKMNASCIGEQISSDEFLGYFNRLPCGPSIDLDDNLEDTAMDKQEVLYALYRFRYLKYQIQQQTSEKELLDDKLKSLLDKSEDDCNQKFLEEEGFFRRFEEDWTLDWFIHPDYEECSALTDYQRLVLRNYNGTEYSRWSDYHKYLHSYKTEKEYLKYCEELSKKLKWMDDYVDDYCPSFEWGCITTRGAYQAIKIAATDFQEITPTLAYNGYNEYEESMSYDAAWFKGYGDIYFEIWRRVTQKSISFKDALQEVCKLNMCPLRQRVMEAALECDYTLKWMESDYQTCTKAIASGDTEEKAQKLIAEAVPTMFEEQASKEELHSDKLDKSVLDISEDDCNKEFLIKERFFRRFEQDKTFDWFFHPDYLDCSFLDDYQRLVLKNHGYSKWSEYHKYLHSYEIEREYVRYCEELSKQLKWMERYVGINRESVKWGKISSRGALQAIKIAATSFHKITSCLAFTGYYECKESMAYDAFWFKEYDGVYFEIWRRVTHGMKSFRDALEEVYNLNMFPWRQRMMKAALEYDETMWMIEDEFQTCTTAITPEVKEDKAKELIAEAVNKRVKKPKSYEEYIIKKIHIARIIGILDSDEE